MKFTINAHAFASAVAWAARSLPRNPAVPVLGGLRLTVDDGQVTVSGFDYEVCAHARLVAEVTEPGTVLVSGRMLTSICERLPDADLHLTADAAHVELACRRAHFNLLTLPLADYPDLPAMPEAVGRADAAAFARAAGQTVIAAGTDPTVPMQWGVLLDFGDTAAGGALTLAATDKFRLAVRHLSWEPILDAPTGQIIVSRETINQISRTMADRDALLTLGLAWREGADNPHLFGVETGGRQLITQLLDVEFINVGSVIPGTFIGHARMNTAEAIEAVRRVAVTAERSTPICLAITPGEDVDLTFSAGSGADASGDDVISATYDGAEPITLAFNPTRLLDALTALDSDVAHLAITGTTRAALLTPAPIDDDLEYRHVLMPVKLAAPAMAKAA